MNDIKFKYDNLKTKALTELSTSEAASNGLYNWIESQFWSFVGVSILIGVVSFAGPRPAREFGKAHVMWIVIAMIAVPMIPATVAIFKSFSG